MRWPIRTVSRRSAWAHRLTIAAVVAASLGARSGAETAGGAAAGPSPAARATSSALSQEAPAPGAPAPAARETTATPPSLRLPDTARPLRYAAELTVIPTEETFSGTIDIEVVTTEPLSVLWLNANELTITKAEALRGGQALAARPAAAAENFVGLHFEPPLPAGPSRLHLEYAGKLAGKEIEGVIRQAEGGEWYVFTDFEAIDARRAFPCFDEPSFKVPWELTLKVRRSDQAFSNTPVASESDAGGGLKRVRFAPTKPLPSYLVAFAVGPFEVVDAGRSPRSQAPVRIITPRGMQARARWARESSVPLLALLEDYFDSRYPYEKLDCISVPQFGGAMENPGLVTFNQRLILSRPEEETIAFRQAYARVATHEFAHQWFGDLVTMAWWNDTWLNEAFASWMTPKILERWRPSWGAAESRTERRSRSMVSDALITARKVRQPVESDDDIKNAFDNITYGKGEAVIDMFERWVGAEPFQRGVQRYMRDHAWGNATAGDFLAAVSAEAGRDIAPAFSSFLDQPGVPLVSVELRCGDGATPLLELSQQRYLPEGSPGAPEADQQSWQIPVCARWGAGKSRGRSCTLLTQTRGQLALGGLSRCPDWVLPNETGAGYYRALMAMDQLTRLLRDGGKQLTAPERIGVVGDLSALVHAGKVAYAEALALVPRLAQDKDRFVVQSTIELAGGLRDAGLVPQSLQPAYARFIRDTYGARAHKLGWLPRRGEDEDTRLLRASLVPLVADQGEDPRLIAEARRLTAAWLADHRSVDPEMAEAVLATAARYGDRALFETLHERARKEMDRQERRRLLSAMSLFRDPEIVRTAMEITLRDEFDARESIGLLWGATSVPQTRPLAYQFVKERFDELVERLPRDSGARFPSIGAALCDEERHADVAQFFKDRSLRFTGGPRVLAQALEQMRLCTALRRTQGDSVSRFLSSWP